MFIFRDELLCQPCFNGGQGCPRITLANEPPAAPSSPCAHRFTRDSELVIHILAHATPAVAVAVIALLGFVRDTNLGAEQDSCDAAAVLQG